MVSLDLSKLSPNCPWIVDKWNANTKEQKVVIGVVGASTVVATSVLLYRRCAGLTCSMNRKTVLLSLHIATVFSEWRVGDMLTIKLHVSPDVPPAAAA